MVRKRWGPRINRPNRLTERLGDLASKVPGRQEQRGDLRRLFGAGEKLVENPPGQPVPRLVLRAEHPTDTRAGTDLRPEPGFEPVESMTGVFWVASGRRRAPKAVVGETGGLKRAGDLEVQPHRRVPRVALGGRAARHVVRPLAGPTDESGRQGNVPQQGGVGGEAPRGVLPE